jgi:hypothetical protein
MDALFNRWALWDFLQTPDWSRMSEAPSAGPCRSSVFRQVAGLLMSAASRSPAVADHEAGAKAGASRRAAVGKRLGAADSAGTALQRPGKDGQRAPDLLNRYWTNPNAQEVIDTVP